jgi:phenylpropionate dioxygenase-like ring-hydroxylating dioxygenase large terminal subunit
MIEQEQSWVDRFASAPLSPRRSAFDPSETEELLTAGATLPAAFYTSEEIARLEDELIWRRAWQPLGVEPELKRVGDYFTSQIGGAFFEVPIVVVRDESMGLRAFVNVCRHRAHAVAVGSGTRRSLQCSYHGWTYGLDGCLRAVPRQEEGGLPPFEQLGLYPLPLDTWGGYIFVAIEPKEPLIEFLGDYPELIRQRGYSSPFAPENVDPAHDYSRLAAAGEDAKFGALDFGGRIRSEANWKAQHENNIECYHCPTTHTHSIAKISKVDQESFGASAFDRGGYHTIYFKDEIAEGCGLTVPGREPDRFSTWLFPAISLRFGGGMPQRTAGIQVVRPAGVNACYLEGVVYPLPGADSHPPISPQLNTQIEDSLRRTIEEDIEVASRVQIGLRSGEYSWGYTLPESESNMRHFYQLVWNALGPALTSTSEG